MAVNMTLTPYDKEARVRLLSRDRMVSMWGNLRIGTSSWVLMVPARRVGYTVAALVLTVLICLLLSIGSMGVLTWVAIVYIAMELAENFALSYRRSFEGTQSHRFEKLDDSQRKLVYQRNLLWAPRLLASYLRTELEEQTYLRFLVTQQSGGRGSYENIPPNTFRTWGLTRLREFKEFGPRGTAIMDNVLSSSTRGSENEVNQVRDVVTSVDLMVDLWKDVARWVLRCRSVRVEDTLAELPPALSVLGMGIFDALRALPDDLDTSIDEAVEVLGRYGGECEVTVILSADCSEFSKAINDLQT